MAIMLPGLTGFIFGLFLSFAIALLIYLIGAKISARGRNAEGKFDLYAYGERVQTEKVIINLEQFFIYAVYFMIFHIFVFSLATTLDRLMSQSRYYL